MKKSKKIIFSTGNIYLSLLVKFLLALVLLLITQWVFWIVNRNLFMVSSAKDFFSIVWGSIVFAIFTTCILQLPFIILNIIPFNFRYKKNYQRVANIFLIIGIVVALMPNIIDIVYYQFTYRRMSSDIFQYLGVGGSFTDLIPAFFKDYWVYFLLFALFLWGISFVVNRMALLTNKIPKTGREYMKSVLFSVIVVVLLIIGIRGSFGYRPINMNTATKYTSAGNVSLVINTPFSIIKTFDKKGLQKVNYFSSEEELERVFTPVNLPYTADTAFEAHPTTNVVIIILESFSAEYMGCMNGGKESYTPFLDSLASQSLVFRGMANGKRSIEAIPSVLSGLPTIMDEPYITSMYGQNDINSLAEILKKYGYWSAFFHGAYNGSMGFDAFSRFAQFDEYYGETEYNNKKDGDGIWGIFDEPFLQFMAAKLEQAPKPFLATVFTISSHHPYKVPEQHKGQFKKGALPILETVGYTDYALKRFFEKLSHNEWFKNTLFVITGDHTAQAMDQFYNNSYGMYNVPMIFYKYGMEKPGFTDRIVQQSDVLPSIIDFLKLNEKSIAFGKSFLNPQNEAFHVSFVNGYYQLIKDNYLIKFNENVIEAYNVKTDPMLKDNIINTDSCPKEEIEKLEKFLKAYIQQYNNRIIENRLIAH